LNYNHLYYFWHVYREGSVVGAAEALFLTPQTITGQIKLDAAVVEGEPIHLRCFESAHEMLLEELSQHKLNMINSDCPIDSTQQEGLFSVKIGECSVSFWCINPVPDMPFPACLESRRLLIPGRKLLNWFTSQGLEVEVLGEFDDAALMKAFGAAHNAIFVAPILYAHDFFTDERVVEIGRVDNVMEGYHTILPPE